MNRSLPFSLLAAVSLLSLSAVAAVGCNGNVIVDGPGGTAGSGGSVASTGDAGGSPCDVGELCNGQCTDVYNDTFNCGYCNNICYEGYCSAGGCVAYTNSGCPAGLTLCGSSCVDTFSDPLNCGGCFNECADGSTCEFGNCTGSSECVGCGDYITGQSNMPLCDGFSAEIYDKLIQCICFGACVEPCDPACNGMGDISPECQDCIVDTGMGCGNEFNECANDL